MNTLRAPQALLLNACMESKFIDFSQILKTKILEKIVIQIFNPTSPGEGGIKISSLRNWSESLSYKIWIFEHTKISLNPTDKPSVSKIEQVTGIFVSRVMTKSCFCKIFKSTNLIQFFRFGPNFWYVSSISIEILGPNSK